MFKKVLKKLMIMKWLKILMNNKMKNKKNKMKLKLEKFLNKNFKKIILEKFQNLKKLLKFQFLIHYIQI